MNYYTEVLRKYAVFKGRASRKEYWMFTLVNIIISVLLLGVIFGVAMVTNSAGQTGFSWPVAIGIGLALIYHLAILIPTLAVSIRRLHDTGRSGWWFLINFIPYLGGLVFLVFMVLDSEPGENRYGPNPKGIPAEVTESNQIL
jgi:uncharacterized membrane protein YhaH (DUF805 family)